jgi:hypothetical protein
VPWRFVRTTREHMFDDESIVARLSDVGSARRPAERAVHWLELAEGEYRDVRHSGLIDLGPPELSEQIDWPPVERS